MSNHDRAQQAIETARSIIAYRQRIKDCQSSRELHGLRYYLSMFENNVRRQADAIMQELGV